MLLRCVGVKLFFIDERKKIPLLVDVGVAVINAVNVTWVY